MAANSDNISKPNTPERRDTLRRNIFIPIVCRELTAGKATGPNIQVVIRDISEDGLSFKSKTIYSTNVSLMSEIFLPTRKVPINPILKVERVDSIVGSDNYMIGCAFADITPDDKKAVLECLDSLDLYKILDEAKKIEASDIHLTVGHPAIFRTRGRLSYMQSSDIREGEVKAMLYPLLTDQQIEIFEKNHELDFAFSPSLESRYRVNMHMQRGFTEAALRSIPANAANFRKLNLPEEQLQKFCREKAGLILISGKTGAGKTTTLTTMIDYANRELERVIITIEDPIEYIHRSKKSVVKQRELGSDTASYSEALRHSLRQDPDIIVVSELLDGEAVMSAIRAAETGHLVIATIHAPDTAATIERILNLFPPEHGNSICQQLSTVLVGIMFQMLVPDKKGQLVAATELMVVNNAIRSCIREARMSQIHFTIQTGAALGMYTLDTCLRKLHEDGVIEEKILTEFTTRMG